VESVLIESIQCDLFTEDGFIVFKEEFIRLLAERLRTQAPDRERATRQLEQVKGEIANIMAAIKAGILTVSTKAALEKAEGERARLHDIIKTRVTKTDNVALLLANLERTV